MPDHNEESPTARVIALAMERLEIEGRGAPSKLARLIGMDPYGENAGTIRKWLRGDHAPRAEYLLALLSGADMLTPEADRAWRGEAPDAARAARAAAAAAPSVARLGRAAQARRERGTG